MFEHFNQTIVHSNKCNTVTRSLAVPKNTITTLFRTRVQNGAPQPTHTAVLRFSGILHHVHHIKVHTFHRVQRVHLDVIEYVRVEPGLPLDHITKSGEGKYQKDAECEVELELHPDLLELLE